MCVGVFWSRSQAQHAVTLPHICRMRLEEITAAELRSRKKTDDDMFLDNNGGCTRYNIFNRDAPKNNRVVVLVHGATIASKVFFPLARKLADATKSAVVTYDQYARGLSDRLVPGIDYSVRARACNVRIEPTCMNMNLCVCLCISPCRGWQCFYQCGPSRAPPSSTREPTTTG